MRLYMINHAHAVPREEVESLDKRPLSEKGRKDTKNLAAFLVKNGEQVSRVLHVDTSWTRENAELLGKLLGGVKVEATSYTLQSGSDIAPFIDEVNSCRENTALAGPSDVCFKAVTQLLAGRQEPYAISFENGVCACLERADDGAWTLQWMNRPDQLAD